MADGLVVSTMTLSSNNWNELLQAQNITVTGQQPVLEPEYAAMPRGDGRQEGADSALFGTHVREAVRVLRGR